MIYLPTSTKQVVFIHIPKTAGSTLRAIIARNYKPENIDTIYTADKPKHKARNSIKNSGKQMIYGHFHFVEEILNPEIYSFTMLRNPVKRVVSFYLHVKYSETPLHKKLMEGVKTFPDFLSNPPVYNLQTRFLSGYTHEKFMADEVGGYQTALDNLEKLSFVGLTERFEDALLCLSTDLFWNKLKFVNDNVQKRTEESAEILEKYTALINEKVQLDLSVYEKASDLLNKRTEKITFAQKKVYQLRKKI